MECVGLASHAPSDRARARIYAPCWGEDTSRQGRVGGGTCTSKLTAQGVGQATSSGQMELKCPPSRSHGACSFWKVGLLCERLLLACRAKAWPF